MTCISAHVPTMTTTTSPLFTSVNNHGACTSVGSVAGRGIRNIDNTKTQVSGIASSLTASSLTENSVKAYGIAFRHVTSLAVPLPCTYTVENETLSTPSPYKHSYKSKTSECPANDTGSRTQADVSPIPEEPDKNRETVIVEIEDSTPESPLIPAEDKNHKPARETVVTMAGGDTSSIHLSGDSSSASDIFSEIRRALNPDTLSHRFAAQHDDTLKKFAAKVLCNGAAGTISADALNYINQAQGATAIISAMVAIGIADGLYSCGKHLHDRKQQPDNILRMAGYGTYNCISPAMNLLPEALCQCIRKAYIYGSLTGASGTILADFLSLLSNYAMSPAVAIYVTGYVCPILLLTLTSAGAIAGGVSAYKIFKKMPSVSFSTAHRV